ncbi:hypothetical protein ACHAWU_004312 [Discostella pseudostelligera]|uniref:CBF1-interacting co-repressor CIR N-terminal domain-containing protein n=1 Tax=Discostella pseudostelligera TaxID=259834 RepID=A0ABD3M371_9STRA
MGGGLAFLTKKSFNPANWSNQKQVWEARQKDDIEKRRLAERESQLRREREEEDLARVVGGEEGHGRKALSFMYEAGKVPGLDRKVQVDNGAAAAGAACSGSGGGIDDFGGGSGGHGMTVDANGNSGMPSLFERQPGDDDAAAAFRAMLARGSMVADDQPTQPSQVDNRANSNNNEVEANNGKDEEEATNEARDRDLRTNLEKAVGRGITSGSGVTLAQQMERFPMLKGAPRVLPKSSGGGGGEDGKESSENDVVGLNFKPLGQVLRNVKCLKCGQWGHSMGDRECGVSGWNPFAAAPSTAAATTMAASSLPPPVASSSAAAAAAAAAHTNSSIVADGTRNGTTSHESEDIMLPMKRGAEKDSASSPEQAHHRRSRHKDKRSRHGRDKDESRHKRRKSSSRRRHREDDIALGYDCCMERYGRGEYGFRPGTRNRFSNGYSNGIPISPDEPLHNVDLVDEFGNELEFQYSRRANDILYIDESCVGLRDPHMACISDRFAASASKMRPPCWDNNQTVDSTLACFTPIGNKRSNCMQIAFSQNAYIFGCGGKFANDDSCGTYLEIHKPNGSPYDDEATILSDSKITVSATNGMLTTTIPLTYKGDPKRILCSYDEVDIRVGSMVRVHSDAPTCCCPPWLSPLRTSKIGAFFCPKRQWSKDGGPFAPALSSLEEEYMDDRFQRSFPWCPALDAEDQDFIMCTQERVFADDVEMSDPSRYFVHPCTTLEEVDGGGYTSADVSGIYNNRCPYGVAFKGCGLGLSPNHGCHMKDHRFSFKDEIGKVFRVSDDKKYGVSFNDGRSLYWFDRNELEFLKPDGSYEVWWTVAVSQ